MLRSGGYLITTGPTGVFEADTFTCCHCNRIVIVKANASASDSGGWCCNCSKPICGAEPCMTCTPYERQMERAEARDRFLRSAGL